MKLVNKGTIVEEKNIFWGEFAVDRMNNTFKNLTQLLFLSFSSKNP